MTQINTYNESSLHKKLKTIYALEHNGKTEQKKDGFIFDIVTKESSIIEIQTSSLTPLKAKIEWAAKNEIKIKVVHPVIEEKIIKTLSEDGTVLKTSKSPVKETYYSAVKRLTGIWPYLSDKNFELELINISITEIRRQTSEKIQTINKKRRHLKNWIKEDKTLNYISSKKVFSMPEDYIKLLPPSLPQEFTPPELKNALYSLEWPENFTKKNRNDAAKQYGLLIWLLEKTGLIEYTGKKQGRSKIYRIKGVSAD